MAATEEVTIKLAGRTAYLNRGKQVKAWRDPACPHLAIHAKWTLLPGAYDSEDWTITHVPTGVAIRDVASQREAERVLEALVRLKLDWSFESLSDPRYEAVKQPAIEVLRSADEMSGNAPGWNEDAL